MKPLLGRRWVAFPVAALALLLAACGSPALGDVEGQVLAMRDAAQQPALLQGASVVLAGNGIDCGKRADHCFARTDEAGKYRFADVPAGDYGIAFSVPAKEGEPRLQEEARQFNVSRGAVETVSVVLLAEGIAKPEVPPELAQRGRAAASDPGLMGNPFFWYFMFNQPWLGGYQRPPVVIYSPGPDRSITVDRNQPAAPSTPGRTYTSYGPTGGAGTKPAPAAIESKGVARPGQAPAVSRDTAPSRVGAGGGCTAGRAPSSSGSRPSSPPRVRVGRR